MTSLGHGRTGRCIGKAGGIAIAATLAVGIIGAAPAAAVELIVTVERVRALDKIDTTIAGQADFYAEVTVDGKSVKSPVIKNDNDVRPNWQLAVNVPSGRHDVKLEILDKNVLKKDALIDINRVNGKRDLDFTVDTRSCTISGFSQQYDCRRTITRSGDERKRAEVQFSVDVRR